MGNPAGDKKKLREKRRKRQELRVGLGTYLPKAERQQLHEAIAKLAASEPAKK